MRQQIGDMIYDGNQRDHIAPGLSDWAVPPRPTMRAPEGVGWARGTLPILFAAFFRDSGGSGNP